MQEQDNELISNKIIYPKEIFDSFVESIKEGKTPNQALSIINSDKKIIDVYVKANSHIKRQEVKIKLSQGLNIQHITKMVKLHGYNGVYDLRGKVISYKICTKCECLKELDKFVKNKNNKSGHRSICKECRNSETREWSKKTGYHRKKFSKNPEPILLAQKKYRESNKEKIREKALNKYKNNIPMVLFNSSKKRAKKRGIIHNISTEDIIIPETCPVLGIPIFSTHGTGRPTANSPSLDRIDNTKGYTKDNIIVISWRANNLKRDASMEELQKIVNFYKDKLNG